MPGTNNSIRIPVSAARVQSPSGVQLIATCRQAYDEGHALYYSSNTFHLPPTMTFKWSDRLQTKHKFLIKRIGITIGANELDETIIRRIEKTYKKVDAYRDCLSNDANVIYRAVTQTLDGTWYSKMSHLVAWSSLEEITLRLFKDSYSPTIPLDHKYTLKYHEHTLPYHECTLQHCELVANFEKWGDWWWREGSYWEKIFWWPSILVSANIDAKAYEVPWTAVIEWLYVGKPGELAQDLTGGLTGDPAENFWQYIKYVEDEIWGDV